MVLTQYFDLDIVKPSLNRLRLVNGDTANTFVITIKENGAAVTLDATLHKIIAVFKRADGEVYTQDATTGLSFTTGGIVTIDLRPASFRTGTNKITLQIYKRESSSATEYPLLLTTQEQSFNARAQAIPDAGAPNAPSQLPMLEQIIHDAGEAVTNCNTATEAANAAATAANNAATSANNAASAANSAASAANAAATDATNAANAAWIRVDACNIALANVLEATTAANDAASAAESAASSANDAAADADHAAQEAYTRGSAASEAASSANTAAAAANTAAAAANTAAAAANAAAAAAAARVGVRYITPTTLTWNIAHTVATGTLGVTRSEIDALLDAGTLVAVYSGLDDSAVVMYPVQSDDMLYFSSLIDGGLYYSAEIYDNTITIQAHRINKNLVLVKHDADWVSDTGAHGSTTLTATELRAMMSDSIFAIQIKGVNYASDNSVITLIESFRDDESNMIYFRTSESVDKRMYVGSMDIDASGSATGIVDVNILIDGSPLMLHVDEITINDADEITSISFVETNQQIFAAIGVRPIEVVIANDSKNYRLREWLNWEETIDPQTPSQTVVNRYAELTAQNVISRESVYLRIHAQKGLMSVTVSGTGEFSTRG